MSKRIPSPLDDRHARVEFRVLIASDWAPIRAFEPVVRRDPLSVYGDLLPLLRAADLRVVNCECALTAARRPVWKSGSVFKGAAEHVRGLTAVPFEVACLANNHVFDYGLPGFRETLRLLRRNGVRTVGAGLTADEARRPLTLAVTAGARRVRVSLVNFSEGEDMTAAEGKRPGVCGWEVERLAETVAALKKRGDCVIAVAHCGLEYIPFPPPYVQRAFRALVDAGADCVVGHHPHVPQGIEVYRERPIAYSLGNFAFFQETNLYHRKVGFCLDLRVGDNTVAGWGVHPYRITDAGLRLLRGPEERRFRDKLRRVSAPLRTEAGVRRAWEATLDYYGPKGFKDEVLRILETMKSDPRKGAAMFRNRLTTPQHAELWRDTLTRMIRHPGCARPPAVSAELTRIIKEWFSLSVR
ncbi:MAG: hypothetical protein FJY83_03260 [Candidatus Aminicenantes bacterium]|nr:hypothetical protein [Candidatus Aminicenantes bacterium]